MGFPFHSTIVVWKKWDSGHNSRFHNFTKDCISTKGPREVSLEWFAHPQMYPFQGDPDLRCFCFKGFGRLKHLEIYTKTTPAAGIFISGVWAPKCWGCSNVMTTGASSERAKLSISQSFISWKSGYSQAALQPPTDSLIFFSTRDHRYNHLLLKALRHHMLVTWHRKPTNIMTKVEETLSIQAKKDVYLLQQLLLKSFWLSTAVSLPSFLSGAKTNPRRDPNFRETVAARATELYQFR